MTSTICNGAASGAIAKRRARDHHSAGKLNLVSLMDIFTILVFFLMLNTGEVEVLQPDEKVVLPKSFATLRPDDSPVIKVNAESISFREQPVVAISDIAGGDEMIQALFDELTNYRQKVLVVRNKATAGEEDDNKKATSISVMGDASIPYALLKRVLYTSAQAGFRDIALAVEYTTTGTGTQQNLTQSVSGAEA